MEWSVGVVLITEPYRFKARTTERGKVWQQTADNLKYAPIIPSSFPRRNSGVFRETGFIAGSTNFSSNKRSLKYQSSKTSRVLKDVMELKHESITLSSLARRALNATCSNDLNLFFPPSWRRPRSRISPANPLSLYRRVEGILRSLLLVSRDAIKPQT